jgi:uncharacterized glyoxalase superfamily protein PhnB
MARVSAYLNFQGQTEEAFAFYARTFGTEVTMLSRYSDMPASGPADLPAGEQGLVMHAELPIIGGHVLMATDMLRSMGQETRIGNSTTLCLDVDSRESAGWSPTPRHPERCAGLSQSGEPFHVGGQVAASVASVDNAGRLEQKYVRGSGVRARAVFHAAWHHEQLPGTQHHIAVPHLDRELSVQYQEELIGVRMPVPGELALDLHDPDVVVVDLGDLLRRPVLGESCHHRVYTHRFHILIVTPARRCSMCAAP